MHTSKHRTFRQLPIGLPPRPCSPVTQVPWDVGQPNPNGTFSQHTTFSLAFPQSCASSYFNFLVPLVRVAIRLQWSSFHFLLRSMVPPFIFYKFRNRKSHTSVSLTGPRNFSRPSPLMWTRRNTGFYLSPNYGEDGRQSSTTVMASLQDNQTEPQTSRHSPGQKRRSRLRPSSVDRGLARA